MLLKGQNPRAIFWNIYYKPWETMSWRSLSHMHTHCKTITASHLGYTDQPWQSPQDNIWATNCHWTHYQL